MLSHGADCSMGNIFRDSHILQLISRAFITAKYEKRGKYLSILHEAMCDHYFTLNAWLNKMYQELSYLLLVSGLLNII